MYSFVLIYNYYLVINHKNNIVRLLGEVMNINLERAETDVLYLTGIVDYLVENINNKPDMSNVLAINEIVSSLEKKHRRNKDKMQSVMRLAS